MKLKFDANQAFQLEAVESIVSVFEGQPRLDSSFEYILNEDNSFNLIAGIANKCHLSHDQLLENVRIVQKKQNISQSNTLDGLNFSVEMETGTGKTYVYLRTIYELSKTYGFKKFVIVVPGVAIREGVLKNLSITHDHFQMLYDKIPVHFTVYDSGKPATLRSFAMGNNIEILVINIDAFAKDENIINRTNDRLTGQRPIEFIQSTNPIVIVDEPQNMETDKRKEAIQSLNPLCTLRYSATHRNVYNLVYSLNPVKAYDLGLVKQIEVDSIITEDSFNNAFVTLENVSATKSKVTAKITIDVNGKFGVKRQSISVRAGDDLYVKSAERDIYREGYLIEEIDAANECILFSNGTTLYKGQNQGGFSDEIMKVQVKKTIEEHLKKELHLNPKGIKVLSLFFIDRVANYREYDAQGNPTQGKLAKWFEDLYLELINKPEYQYIKNDVSQVHGGYFSRDRKGKLKDTNGNTLDDNHAYELIMKDKETLLSLDNPLKFIFSHSALREGWDNPNVFQICTLNESKSDMKKRQEIGRGLRLAVNQDGERCFEKSINRLTVIANESYDDFAKALQKEIEDDCGVSFDGRIKNSHKKATVCYRKGFELDETFKEIWNRIKFKTSYQVEFRTNDLILEASKALIAMPKIEKPKIRITKKMVSMDAAGIEGRTLKDGLVELNVSQFNIPDILGYIQNQTELTRATIFEILTRSGRLGDSLVNPQLFLDLTVNAIKRVLSGMMMNGIKYSKIGTVEYEMRLFDDVDLQVYLDGPHHKVANTAKTIYENYIPLDSNIESDFAKDCESSEQVEFYFKLPNWFKIPTPIGHYNPDWALIFKNEKRIYFVAETKSTLDGYELRLKEQQKIKCGESHFKELGDVEYRHVTKLGDLVEQIPDFPF